MQLPVPLLTLRRAVGSDTAPPAAQVLAVRLLTARVQRRHLIQGSNSLLTLAGCVSAHCQRPMPRLGFWMGLISAQGYIEASATLVYKEPFVNAFGGFRLAGSELLLLYSCKVEWHGINH